MHLLWGWAYITPHRYLLHSLIRSYHPECFYRGATPLTTTLSNLSKGRSPITVLSGFPIEAFENDRLLEVGMTLTRQVAGKLTQSAQKQK